MKINKIKINQYGKLENIDIDLKKFSDKECIGNYSTKYNLIGIGNHTGSMDFGHYYAFINIQNKWYEFNDSIVKESSFKEASTFGDTYILFYKKVD